MNVLVVNIGSTSFKFRLLDMTDERVLASGSVEGIGRPSARVTLQLGDAQPLVTQQSVADQAAAIATCMQGLGTGGGGQAARVDAVGFKAVHGGHICDAVRVTPEVLSTMESFAQAAPSHNPAYLAAMKAFAEQMPGTPLVAAFETGFHQTIPHARHTYAIPYAWTSEHGVRRYGFHGASHRYVAMRVAELRGRDDLRVISCHLGGSSSICAIRCGKSIGNSFGMTPQSGLPQNNRVGDFDTYALLLLRDRTGRSIDDLMEEMARAGGLLGISGISNDMAEIVAAAEAGDPRAELALSVYVESVRDYLGAYLVALRGLDVLVFTGGIGERSAEVRRRVCDGLGFLGIRLDQGRNESAGSETTISTDDAPVQILTLRTNEELIVARQTRDVLTS
jgi:acetate kinase